MRCGNRLSEGGYMKHKKLIMAVLMFLFCALCMIGWREHKTIQAAMTDSGMVDGIPAYRSACAAPENVQAGGYNDAVTYNDYVCNGRTSSWTFKNGYIFWSTRSKAAEGQKATLYRSIGWDITFSADLNADQKIDSNEQMTISVAKTIQGIYYPNMNYYYINYQQKETDGVLYNYSLYAMSYDRLQELAMNHEADQSGGKNPITTAIFRSEKVTISIDAIMTTVERDANGNEKINGAIYEENGTSRSGVDPDATGNIKTRGNVYHCNNINDYEILLRQFNKASLETYKNTGTVSNYMLTLEFYADKEVYGARGIDGWSVHQTTGQIFYEGKPYTQSVFFWEAAKIPDLKSKIEGEGYRLTGQWRCAGSDCYVNASETYHTSYLAQHAQFSKQTADIYEGSGILRLYADSAESWSENEYTIEYYSVTGEKQQTFQKIASQICRYSQTYRYYGAGNTAAPRIEGGELLYWTRGLEPESEIARCGANFSGKDFPETKKKTGNTVRLYAVWGVQVYAVTCNENCAKGKESRQTFYEIYGIGFTKNKELADTKTSTNPFYWAESEQLCQSNELDIHVPQSDGYIWNGFWDKQMKRQYIASDGTALFDSARTFERDTAIYGDWRKNYTLTIMYKLGDNAFVSKNDHGYGIDEAGYLTIDGKTVTARYLATDSVKVLAIFDCIEKEGGVRSDRWQIAGTKESVPEKGTYMARTLAKKAGGNLNKEDVAVVLQLAWSEFQYYVDYYFMNNSTGKYEIKASQLCRYGQTCRFYSELQTQSLQVPDNKVFKGWSRKKNSQDIDYPAEESFCNLAEAENQRVQLYGVWEALTGEIVLSGNCPTDAQNPVEMGSTSIRYVLGEGFLTEKGGNSITDSCRIRVPSCEGYVFTGYYDAQNGGKQMVDATGNVTGEVSVKERYGTFYAGWQQKTYRMTCYANGGTFEKLVGEPEETISRDGILYGNFLPAMTAPHRAGYSFAGYRRKESNGEVWYNRYLNSGNRRYLMSSDVDLYAVWEDDIAPSGTIRTNGGSSSSAWSNRNVRLSVRGCDAGSGVVKMELFCKRYFQSGYQLMRVWESVPRASLEGFVDVDLNGISNFYCVVYDAAGNTNYRIIGTDADFRETVATVLYIDKTAPKVTLPQLGEIQADSDSLSVSVYASDDVIE